MAAAPIALRLFYLQTFRHDELAGKAAKTVTSSTTEVKTRGRILDRAGLTLAESLRTYSCGVLKNDVARPEEMITALSSSLGMPRAQVQAKWDSAKNFFYVKRKLTPGEYETLTHSLRARKLRGANIEVDYTRYYPGGESAKDLLGTVDYENNGSSGLELLYDGLLSGSIGRARAIKDKYGEVIYTKGAESETGASDIYLTLDNRVQFYVESALDAAVRTNWAEGGFAIVQDPRTGDILAAASRPRAGGHSLPFQWTYEPGSTFKLITISAALEKGKIKTSDVFDCGADGKWQFNSKVTLNDDEPLGALAVPDIVAHSSNICSAKIALKLGLEDFYSFIRAYGFGTKTSLEYPGESKGLLRAPENWRPLDIAVTGFGHGIAVTGIQLVSAYSAAANGGLLMEPRLVEKITDTSGRLIYQTKPRALRRVLSQSTAREMNSMLRRVVELGTGANARIRGYTVAGKTGTAQKLDARGKYSSSQHVASFCGFVPALNPRFTILVVIDRPETSAYGAQVAAPAFAVIAKRLLSAAAIPPDAPETLKADAPVPARPPAPGAAKTPQKTVAVSAAAASVKPVESEK
ncbi:MAG: penicillin-binding protein 2 [Elusimicrobiales bacterium]|nr:penicillin-binding protein 2 [Elusimicrobiales bacterium]